jgi:xanthine/uracil permease
MQTASVGHHVWVDHCDRARIWIENRVDFSRGGDLFVAALTLIIGVAKYMLRLGDVTLKGIALDTFGTIILYQIINRPSDNRDLKGAADAMPNLEPPPS